MMVIPFFSYDRPARLLPCSTQLARNLLSNRVFDVRLCFCDLSCLNEGTSLVLSHLQELNFGRTVSKFDCV